MIGIKINRKATPSNYPIMQVLIGTTLTLCIIGIFTLLLLHAQQLTSLIQSQVTLQVYLERSLSESERLRIEQILSQKPYVLRRNGVARIDLFTRDLLAEKFIEETQENFLEVLPENPLRDMYTIAIKYNCHTEDQLKFIREDIESINGVFEVDYVANFIENVNRNLTRVIGVLGVLGILLLGIVSILIGNGIQLAIHAQRFLLRNMELIGASPSFIRRPFLHRACILGGSAGFLAGTLLLLTLCSVNHYVPILLQLQSPEEVFICLSILVGLGAGISWLGTYRALNRYLYRSLDELYR